MHNTGKRQRFADNNIGTLGNFLNGYIPFGAEMNSVTGPFGYPLTYWFTCQGSLGFFVILIFWFAGRQEKIDEEFGFAERGED